MITVVQLKTFRTTIFLVFFSFKSKLQVLLEAVNGVPFGELERLQLPAGFDLVKLERHLKTMGDIGLQPQHMTSVGEVAKALRGLSPITIQLMSEAHKLLKLVMSMPVSVAQSERLFCCLRRLKTWLRSTMTQRRLTHVALLYVHHDIHDDLDQQLLMSEFISKTQERYSVFGKVMGK